MGLGCSSPGMEPPGKRLECVLSMGSTLAEQRLEPMVRRPEKELRMIIWPSTPEVVNAICNVASGEFVANYMEHRVGAEGLAIEIRSEG